MASAPTGIEQINLGFHESEDRLLLKLGLLDKTEISVWITRRLCKVIWSLLQTTPSANVHGQNTPEKQLPANKVAALANFAREATEQKNLEKMDFKKEYDANRDKRTEVPLLATQAVIVTLERAVTEQASTNLELRCQNGQTIKVALNPEITHAMLNMMQLATREAGWDLLFNLDATGFGIDQSKALLH